MTYKCGQCGADNQIVNQCGCDKENMPTKPLPELQTELMLADLGLELDDFAYHATDLYVVAKPGVAEFLRAKDIRFEGFHSQEGSDWEGYRRNQGDAIRGRHRLRHR